VRVSSQGTNSGRQNGAGPVQVKTEDLLVGVLK
jgi:hypothetical protein